MFDNKPFAFFNFALVRCPLKCSPFEGQSGLSRKNGEIPDLLSIANYMLLFFCEKIPCFPFLNYCDMYCKEQNNLQNMIMASILEFIKASLNFDWSKKWWFMGKKSRCFGVCFDRICTVIFWKIGIKVSLKSFRWLQVFKKEIKKKDIWVQVL